MKSICVVFCLSFLMMASFAKADIHCLRHVAPPEDSPSAFEPFDLRFDLVQTSDGRYSAAGGFVYASGKAVGYHKLEDLVCSFSSVDPLVVHCNGANRRWDQLITQKKTKDSVTPEGQPRVESEFYFQMRFLTEATTLGYNSNSIRYENCQASE